MKFDTNVIIQLCSSLIKWVPPCNRCFQAQVLKKITFSCVIWISRVGFILNQIQHLELCSTTRKRNILKNYPPLFQLSWDWHAGYKRSSVCFSKSAVFPQCFNDLEQIKLFITTSNINAQVRKSILTCLAHRIRLWIFTKFPKMWRSTSD